MRAVYPSKDGHCLYAMSRQPAADSPPRSAPRYGLLSPRPQRSVQGHWRQRYRGAQAPIGTELQVWTLSQRFYYLVERGVASSSTTFPSAVALSASRAAVSFPAFRRAEPSRHRHNAISRMRHRLRGSVPLHDLDDRYIAVARYHLNVRVVMVIEEAPHHGAEHHVHRVAIRVLGTAIMLTMPLRRTTSHATRRWQRA